MWDLPDHGWKRLAVLVFYAALICGAVWLGWRLLTGILLPFVLAWLLAFALEPLVRRCAGDSMVEIGNCKEPKATMHVSRIGTKPQSFPIAKRKEMGVRKRSVT